MEIAGRFNYRPNLLVKGVLTGNMPVVALLAGNPITSQIASSVAETCDLLREKGFSTLLYNTKDDPKVESECLRMAVCLRVAGMIINTVNYQATESYYTELRQQKVPFVIPSAHAPSVAVPHIHRDDVRIASEIVRHLTELGHRSIAHIAGPPSTLPRSLRYIGFKAGLDSHGLELPDRWLKLTDWSEADGYRAMLEILGSSAPPTAVFAATDALAFGAIKAIHEKGLLIPRDISIVGMGNSVISPFSSPPLTTVAHDPRELAAKSVELLLGMMSLPNDVPIPEEWLDVTIPGQLVVRGSTGPAPLSART